MNGVMVLENDILIQYEGGSSPALPTNFWAGKLKENSNF